MKHEQSFQADSKGACSSTEPNIEPVAGLRHIPTSQRVLLLRGPGQRYQLVEQYPVSKPNNSDEVLVKTRAIGLNPIDWKAPDYNFGIPELPYISGREAVGEVIQLGQCSSRLNLGDQVIVISTDYRDLRKATYQQYIISYDFNVVRIPHGLSVEDGATIGVAFVTAALALGVCMGADFSMALDGPDLFGIIRQVDQDFIPKDVMEECFHGVQDHERAKTGDWLAVWGGSSTSANLIIQLARLAGLKIVAVVDKAKHGLRLSNHKVLRPDLLVDSYDAQRAVNVIRSNVGDKLRFGIDTRGKDTAASLLRTLTPGSRPLTHSEEEPPTPPATPSQSNLLSSHLIGLTGLPKQSPPEGAVFHQVPIKVFHEVPALGMALVSWLERLLQADMIYPPEIIGVENGLEKINTGLDRMRRGEISGGKHVVRLD